MRGVVYPPDDDETSQYADPLDGTMQRLDLQWVRDRDENRLQSILSFLETYGIPRDVAAPYVIKRFDLDVSPLYTYGKKGG